MEEPELGTFAFYAAPQPHCWAFTELGGPIGARGGGSWIAHPGWQTGIMPSHRPLLVSRSVGRAASWAWGPSLAMRGTGVRPTLSMCPPRARSPHAALLYPLQLPPPPSPVPSHALTHTLLKPDPKTASRAGALCWGSRQSWRQVGACLLEPAPPCPTAPWARAGRSGIPHPCWSGQLSAAQGPSPPWARPQMGTLVSGQKPPNSLPRVAWGSPGPPAELTQTHTGTTSTVTPPHFLLCIALGSASEASAGTEPPTPGGLNQA